MSKANITHKTTVDDKASPALTAADAKVAELPEPVQWLNYKGDVRGQIGKHVGPMLDFDQILTVVREEYDAENDRTRLGLTYGALDVTA